MGISLGWVVFFAAGAIAAPPAEPNATQISYNITMVEANGVGWRETVFNRLKPVARQGAATVWTLPKNAGNSLIQQITKGFSGRVLQSPRIKALAGVPATVQVRENRTFVTQVAWNGDEAPATGSLEAIRVGWHTTLVGRKLDQGILVKMVIEDTEIRGVHKVYLNADEQARNRKSNDSISGPVQGDCKEVTCGFAPDNRIAVEFPEIANQEVLGEWLIPNGECLLASFGPHTVADKDGKAVVRERLAFVEAETSTDVMANSAAPFNFIPAPRSEKAAHRAPAPHAPIAAPAPMPGPPVATELHPALAPATPLAPDAKLPTPPAPSRSFPQGIHTDGSKAKLPPLPDDEMCDESSESESAEPLPSPQTKKPRKPKPEPASDTGTTKASFTQPKSSTVFLPSLFLPGASVGFQFLLPIKPLSLRLPFNQRLEIEIFGRVLPDTRAAVE
jgi:hypothetical protein